MSGVTEWLAQLNNKSVPPQLVAEQILAATVQGDDKAVTAMRLHAQEVLHFAQQLASAETAQWQQSFSYELTQSLKSLKMALKKIAK